MKYKKWGCLDGVRVQGTVLHVHDGDTLHVLAPVGESGGEYDVTCRLACIDAPELKNNTTAKQALEGILKETDNVVFCVFGKRDKYGRILTTLYTDQTCSAISINQRLVNLGEAKLYNGGKR